MNQTTTQLHSTAYVFSQLLSSTRRGARLARLLTVTELRSWGVEPQLTERAELIVAELAANAVFHGYVRGRDFRLGLMQGSTTSPVRVEVTDARGDRLPALGRVLDGEGDGGRGLHIVAALADRWGAAPYPPSAKTVWAECGTGRT
ncbi:ATP-binding protein [Streptomyces sp. NPDC060209]|uniref:ATP-binding protein n=1 Tax=Streptomyces sp. NPDC060209 TaxID=3347073 RepID=UPI00364D0313